LEDKLWLNAKKLNVEKQCGVGWYNSRMSSRSIRVIRRASQSCSLTNAHLSNSFIPSLNDFSFSNLESEWITSVTRRVKFLAIRKSSSVVDNYCLARLGKSTAVSGGNVVDLHAHSDDSKFTRRNLTGIYRIKN